MLNYLTALLSPESTVDEAGLLIICHVFKIKLGVLIDDAFWSCLEDGKVDSCDYYLALRSHNYYSLVRVKEVTRKRKVVKVKSGNSAMWSNSCAQHRADVPQQGQRTVKSEEELRRFIYKLASRLD